MHFPLRLVSLLLFLLILSTACDDEVQDARYDAEGISWEEASTIGEGTVRILYVPAEGFAYEDNQGHLTGVTVEIIREFANWVEDTYGVILNLDFEKEENWQTFYQRVANADEGIIGMGNVTITEERRDEVSFSPAYMQNIAALISHADRPELTSLDDLPEVFPDHDMLAFEGTLHEERLRDLRNSYAPSMSIETAHSNDEIIERVSSEDPYLAYIDIYNFWRAEQNGASLMRHEIGDDAAEEFGYIMPRESDWPRPLREFFEGGPGFLQSTTYREIMERHLGEQLARLLMEDQLN